MVGWVTTAYAKCCDDPQEALQSVCSFGASRKPSPIMFSSRQPDRSSLALTVFSGQTFTPCKAVSPTIHSHLVIELRFKASRSSGRVARACFAC